MQNQAEIISIGTEILIGELTDTNAGYLATQLRLTGIQVGRITAAGDDKTQLSEVFRQALSRTDLLIVTGGLGPTNDDLTRESMAEALGEPLTLNTLLEQELRASFARMHRDMPPNNLRQAMLIPSGQGIPNTRGTAPGWWVEKDGKIIVLMPGPPREMQLMWQNNIKPRLQAKFTGQTIVTRTLKIYGLGEAKVNEMIAPLFQSVNPTLGIYAKPDGIHLRLISHGENAKAAIETMERHIKAILHENIWGQDEDTLPGVIGSLLRKKKYKVAIFDNGTRGIVSNLISQVEDGADYYTGGLLATNNEVIIRWGVPRELITGHGAISAEVAEAMAGVVREKFATDIGLSITGMGGLDDKKVTAGECYIGLADVRGKVNYLQRLLPYRDNMRNLAAVAALFRLRQRLLEG